MKLPAIQFYPGDWLRDNIAGCTLEAQGLWLRMMFIMHDSDRYGYLSRDGVAIPPGYLARRCGITLELYTALLKELTDAGVPSLTENGVIYSRRMVRDAEERKRLHKIRSLAGSKGGRPPLKKSKRKAKVKQIPEVEDEDTVVGDVSVVFEGVWGSYPRKLGKDVALRCFKKALEDGAKVEQIRAALKNYCAHLKAKETEPDYIQHGSTWFNKRWKDWLTYNEEEINLERNEGNGAAPVPGKYAHLGRRDKETPREGGAEEKGEGGDAESVRPPEMAR